MPVIFSSRTGAGRKYVDSPHRSMGSNNSLSKIQMIWVPNQNVSNSPNWYRKCIFFIPNHRSPFITVEGRGEKEGERRVLVSCLTPALGPITLATF